MKYSDLEKEITGYFTRFQKQEETEFQHMRESIACVTDEVVTPQPATRVPQWHMFNQVVGGLRPREFSIICGPTGSGKTTWLAALSAQLLVGIVPHFVASVETGPNDFYLRVISSLAQKDYNDGEAHDKEEFGRVIENFKPILSNDCLILSRYTSKVSPMKMMCDILAARKEHGCKIAILDNLNFFLPFSDAKSAVTDLDKVIHEFIIFCKHVDVHIVMVMHPRKTENGRIEHENDIKGSSNASQEAHNVFLFNRPTKEDLQNYGFSSREYRDLKFAKLRRRGQFVGSRIFYKNIGSHYSEEKLV